MSILLVWDILAKITLTERFLKLTGPGPFGTGPMWAFLGPIWALDQFGPWAHLDPGFIWARAPFEPWRHLNPVGPFGPWAIWAQSDPYNKLYWKLKNLPCHTSKSKPLRR